MSPRKELLITIVQNVFFWTISFLVTLRVFMQTEEIRTIDLIYILLFHVPFIVIVLLNTFYLVPAILKKINFWIYLGLVLIPGFGLTYFLYEIAFGSISLLLFPDYYLVGLYSMPEIFGIMLIYISVSTLIELSKSWFDKKGTDLQLAQLQKEKTQTELKVLRAQINPHFLFNNLNTIYGEALKKSEKAPSMILKLSDILRYIVENMDKDLVSLNDEVEYLTKFIQLQKERLSNPSRVVFKTEGDFSSVTLPPLLLVNFVENCFKYGSTSDVKDRIHIHLHYNQNSLTFHTSNTKDVSVSIEQASSGTGISNARKRLNILFPTSHTLSIKETESHFDLELKLDIK
ncbi:MAG: histidine kinase [Balneolaceae bacterium]